MDLDTVRLFRPITKWNAVVHDARRIPELTRTAFRKALSGRNGPVHLDIPQDVLSMECEFADDEFLVKPANYRPMSTSRAAPEDLRAAAQMLREAQRPLIVAGGGGCRKWCRRQPAPSRPGASRASCADPNGLGSYSDRQRKFYWTRRDYRRGGDPRRLFAGRSRCRDRLPFFLLDVG